MICISDAISSLCPNVSFRVGSTYDSVEFINTSDSFIPPSKEEVELKIAELTAAEPMRLLRLQRDQLLAQTDWRMVSDYPGSNQTEWQTYRQALRDITTQTPSLDSDGNLTGITWPNAPTD